MDYIEEISIHLPAFKRKKRSIHKKSSRNPSLNNEAGAGVAVEYSSRFGQASNSQ